MDQDVLVKNDRDIWAQVLEALSRVAIPVTLGEWHYVPRLEEWQLVIATPWFDSKGPRAAYKALIDALLKAGIYERVPIRRVYVMSPNDPLVKALQQEVKEHKPGSLYVLKPAGQKNGKQYSLIFAPVTGPGAAVPARHFSSLDGLRQFLADDVHVRSSSIEEALDDMERSGTGSIHPVTLTRRQLKRLGLG